MSVGLRMPKMSPPGMSGVPGGGSTFAQRSDNAAGTVAALAGGRSAAVAPAQGANTATTSSIRNEPDISALGSGLIGRPRAQADSFGGKAAADRTAIER